MTRTAYRPPHNSGVTLRVSITRKGFNFNGALCEHLSLLTENRYAQLSYDLDSASIYFRFTSEPITGSMLLRAKPQRGAYLQRTAFFKNFGLDQESLIGGYLLHPEGEEYRLQLPQG